MRKTERKPRNPDPTAVPPMASNARELVYLRQTGRHGLTPAQRRRLRHKNHRALRAG